MSFPASDMHHTHSFAVPVKQTTGDKSRYWYYAAMIATFLVMAQQTWCSFGSLIVDTFRDQIVAGELAQGAVLYRDVYYLFGPLPPYILAALNMLFGTSMYCSICLGLCVIAAFSFLIYRICRFYVSRMFSTIAVLNFLFVFAFNDLQGNRLFNYVLPYSIASYVAVLFLLMSLYFFIRFIHKRRFRDLALWALAMYLCFLSRIYFATPCYAVFLAYALIMERPFSKKTVLFILAPPVLAIITFAAYLLPLGAWSAFQESVLRRFVHEGKALNPLSKINQGLITVDARGVVTPALAHNAALMVKVFGLQSLAVTLLYLAGAWLDRLDFPLNGVIGRTMRKWVPYVAYALVTLAIITLCCPHDNPAHNGFNRSDVLNLTYLSIPLILIVSFILVLLRMEDAGRSDGNARLRSMALVLLIPLPLVSRVIFRVVPFNYGNYIAVIPAIGMLLYFLELFPWALDRYVISCRRKEYFYAGVAVYLMSTGIVFGAQNLRIASQKSLHTITERGMICSFNDKLSRSVWQTVNYLQTNTLPASKVLVVPQGFSINYFSLRASPMPYESYLPHVLDTIGETRIVNEMRHSGIDYVVVVHRIAPEHGVINFGVDYGREMWEWIRDNYTLITVIGDMPFSDHAVFGTAIYKRKDADSVLPALRRR